MRFIIHVFVRLYSVLPFSGEMRAIPRQYVWPIWCSNDDVLLNKCVCVKNSSFPYMILISRRQ